MARFRLTFGLAHTALRASMVAALMLGGTSAASSADVGRDAIVRSLIKNPVGPSRSLKSPRLKIGAPAAQRIKAEPVSADGAVPGAGRIDLAITFELDSAVLSPDAQTQLDELAAALKHPALAKSRVSLNGHTDATGDDTYNMSLSYKRAAAVRDVLTQRHNIPARRLSIFGFGEEQLKDPAQPDAEVNRRVEIINLD